MIEFGILNLQEINLIFQLDLYVLSNYFGINEMAKIYCMNGIMKLF